MSCNQCEMLSIQGIACHESGCPNAGKRWLEGAWVRFVECWVCGYELPEGELCCSDDSCATELLS